MNDDRATVRLNFLVRQEVRQTFEELRERVRLSSLTEVLRKALKAYDVLTAALQRGAILILTEADGSTTRVEFPEFHCLRKPPR